MGPSWPLSQLPAARWRGGCLLPHPPKPKTTPTLFQGDGKPEPQTLILHWSGPNLSIWGEHSETQVPLCSLVLASSLHPFTGEAAARFVLRKG